MLERNLAGHFQGFACLVPGWYAVSSGHDAHAHRTEVQLTLKLALPHQFSTTPSRLGQACRTLRILDAIAERDSGELAELLMRVTSARRSADIRRRAAGRPRSAMIR